MDNVEQRDQNYPAIQPQLPNSTGVLVLGILSIVFCWCYGIPGLVLGIIAMVMASKALQMYNAAPDSYSEASFKNLKAGKICAIVGICLSALYFVFIIIWLVIFGAALTSMPWNTLLNQ